MRKAIVCLAVLGLTIQATSTAQAGGWSDFWDRFYIDTHRNNCWPEPFVRADRQAARAPFCHDDSQRLASAEHAERRPVSS